MHHSMLPNHYLFSLFLIAYYVMHNLRAINFIVIQLILSLVHKLLSSLVSSLLVAQKPG